MRGAGVTTGKMWGKSAGVTVRGLGKLRAIDIAISDALRCIVPVLHYPQIVNRLLVVHDKLVTCC